MCVLCIGSAALDITCASIPPQDTWQDKQHIDRIRLLPGGDALNQAVVLQQLGQRAELVSAVGPDDNGRLLREMLSRRGVGTRFFYEKPEAVTKTSLLLVDAAGERHAFAAGHSYEQLTAGDLPPLAGVRAISLASLFQLTELERNGLAAWLHEARKQGIPVFADLGADKGHLGLAGIAALLPEIDYFLPSLTDALQISGTATAEEAAEVFLSCGTGCAVIKCGADGCLIRARGEQTRVPALPVTPVDTTGAGDSMVAAFIDGLLRGLPLAEACRIACSLASWSTLFAGANAAPLATWRSLL